MADTERLKQLTGKKPDSKKGKGKRGHSRTTSSPEGQTTSSLTDRTTSLPTKKIKCRACKQGHDFSQCYYLFLKKAPKWFKPNEAIMRRVEQNLKEDDTLAEEVARLRKSMKKVTFKESEEDD